MSQQTNKINRAAILAENASKNRIRRQTESVAPLPQNGHYDAERGAVVTKDFVGVTTFTTLGGFYGGILT